MSWLVSGLLLCFLVYVCTGSSNNNTELAPATELTLNEVTSWLPSAAQLLRYDFSGADCDCRTQSLQLLQSAERLQPQALQMLDSWAKFPSGVLRGNVNQLGDFDECVGAGGRYCLATVDLRLPPALAALDSRLHAHYAISSSLDDPGHRLPRFSVLHWAVCVPAACSPHHLQAALSGVLAGGRGESRGLVVRARVDQDLCQAGDDPPIVSPLVALFGWCFFISILLLCILGTTADIISSNTGITLPSGKLWQVLKAFSVPRNMRHLLDTEGRGGEVAGLHGARALNALGLLLSHKQMALMFLPYSNRTDLAQVIGKSWSMIGRTAILYTDSFILLSGLLSARTFLKELKRSNSLNLVDNIISRLIRLTPSLAALIVFCSAVLPGLGSGPMWGLLVNKYANLCHSYWWRNLLFIHNHFPFTEMCLTHSHQIGIDMQLFLMSPLLVYIIWKRPKAGVFLLLLVSSWSSVLRYTVTLSQHLSTVIYYGVPISQLFKTAEKTYILPSHRATVYCLGIALGYFFDQYKNYNISKSQHQAGGKKETPAVQIGLMLEELSSSTYVTVALGWVVTVLCGLMSIFGPYHMSWPSYVYSPQEAAVYNAVAPILWSLFVGWAIFASHYGYGGWFGKFLGWRWFAVFTKLSYAVYLTQFPIFFYNVARARTSQHYSIFTLLNIPEYAAVMVASIVLTLAIDLPAQNLKKTFLHQVSSKSEVAQTTTEFSEEIINQELAKQGESTRQRRRLPGTM